MSHPKSYSKIPKIICFACLFLFIFPKKVQAQKNDSIKFDSIEFTLVFTKSSSDYDLKNYVLDLKQHGISREIQRKKRNTKGALIELVMKFEDKNGINGKSKQIRVIPIRKVFLNVKKFVDGSNQIGFFDNESLKNIPFDPEIEKKISIIENLRSNAVIYIDDNLSNKFELENLNVYAINKIEIKTDLETLKKYNVIKKKEVVIVTLNKVEY
ncbi:MAG: hypothetical protein ACOVLC_00630 [Flavobacterium sp.]